jgi:hypothetical protein
MTLLVEVVSDFEFFEHGVGPVWIALLLLASLLNDRTFNEAESPKTQEAGHKNGGHADPSRNVPAVDYHVPLEDEPQ